MRHEDGAGDQRLREAWAPPVGLPWQEPPRRRRHLWLLAAVPLAVVLLPLLAGLLLALGGLASEDFEWGSEDGPDSAATTLAEGQRTTEDLTADVVRALAVEGRSGEGLVCPVTPLDAVPTAVRCSGSVDGWERVSVDLHQAGRFTVVGSVTRAEPRS